MSGTRRVQEDCRHYVMQTVSRESREPRGGAGGRGQQASGEQAAGEERSGRAEAAERIERCRVGANEPFPFACPQGCLFYEPRSTSSAGWRVDRP